MSRTISLGSALALAAVFLSLPTPASADPLVLSTKTCTARNCSSLALPGRINGHPEVPALSSPWVGEVAATAGGCLRAQIVAQKADLAMTLVAPDGTVYTSDDGGGAGCAKCPKVVVGSARSGVYTIIVNTRTGAAAETSFDLRVQAYKTGNPNCAGPSRGT